MKYIEDAFVDVIDGKMVKYYKDRKGVVWMKTSRFVRLKVRATERTQARLNK